MRVKSSQGERIRLSGVFDLAMSANGIPITERFKISSENVADIINVSGLDTYICRSRIWGRPVPTEHSTSDYDLIANDTDTAVSSQRAITLSISVSKN